MFSAGMDLRASGLMQRCSGPGRIVTIIYALFMGAGAGSVALLVNDEA
jgi:hypothetical protein